MAILEGRHPVDRLCGKTNHPCPCRRPCPYPPCLAPSVIGTVGCGRRPMAIGARRTGFYGLHDLAWISGEEFRVLGAKSVQGLFLRLDASWRKSGSIAVG